MRSLALCVVVGFVFAGLGFAQGVNASVGGTVSDSSGAVVPNATVVATGIDTGVETKTQTNGSGAYSFPSLQAGRYRVSTQMTGFQTSVYDPVVLDVGAQVRLNFTLSVATSGTTVEVSAAAESPLLASSAVVGGLVTGQQILDLPLIDQNAANLALTQAQFAGGIGGAVSVAGGGTMALLTTVNGISVSNTRLDRAGGLLSFQFTQGVDMVEEVKTVSSPADAEFGRSLGQVSMIVRSGTNQFHGSVVDGLRNTDLNSNVWWNNYQGLPRQALKRNQYAARLGGPIQKNKTFFFALYAGDRQRLSASTTNTVLTQQARQGLFRFFPGAINANASAVTNATVDSSGNPVQPASATGPLQTVQLIGRDPNRPTLDSTGLAQNLISWTPLPNNFISAGDGLNTAGFTWQVPYFTDMDQLTFKVDHYFTQNHHINIVVTHEHQWYTSTAGVYPTDPSVTGFANSQLHSWFASVGFASTLKPTLLNEFKIGLQHPDLYQGGNPQLWPKLWPKNNNWAYTPSVASYSSPLPAYGESELIDPVYTIGDTISWTHGAHTIKWGFQVDSQGSNSFNILNNGLVPGVTFGAGSVAVQGVSNITGLVTQNQTLANNMMTDMTGSVSTVVEGFGVANGKNPVWIPYPNRRAWMQRDASSFLKDDWKATSNLTMNIGVRWDWVGVPWDKWGRTPQPSTGFSGLFGISGTNFNSMWSPGASSGALTQMITVGPNSANPDKQMYHDFYKAFEPAIGLSWSIPYFGKDKTVLRAGFTFSRPISQSFLTIDGATSSMGTSTTLTSGSAMFLSQLSLPLSPNFSNPLQVWPVNDKTQSINAYDPNFKPSVIESYNASLERQLTSTTTLAIRYVGNRSTHLPGSFNVNSPNVFESGFYNATNITAQGGNAPLLDQLLNGVNVAGVGVVNGTTLTGSQALRSYSGTWGYFAGNSAAGLAGFFNTSQSFGAAGTTPVRGWMIGNAGLPANLVVVNPQYSGATDQAAFLNAHYDSGVIELNHRLTHGFAFQTNFVWAKSMSLNGTSLNYRNWGAQRTMGGQQFTWKASGTYQLPFGKGKKFLNAKSGAGGVLADILGNWQYGSILTLNSGSYMSPSCSGTPGFGSTNNCSSMMALPSDPGHVIKAGKGVFYYDPAVFTQANDPYCTSITNLNSLQSRCTFKEMLYKGQPLFANSPLGQMGSMSNVTSWKGPKLFDLDMNLLKRFTIKERFTVELRVDAIASTNTAHFTSPNMTVNGTTFGVISAPSMGLNNTVFTSPAAYYGNRVMVANLRVSF